MDPRFLAFDHAGTGDRIVMIPGGLTGWLSWIPHQQRLAERWRTIRAGKLGSAVLARRLPSLIAEM